MIVVFVHGWSVRSTDTYGSLPERLRKAAKKKDLDIDVHQVFLSKYVSFRDEVRVPDLAQGMEAAVTAETVLASATRKRQKLAVITHSTGGPVVREWWQRFYLQTKRACPMSHLIMLAPANFGSALAQLGKSKISRLKSWFEGVEPGQGVLDWLELGSAESWRLNESWIRQEDGWAGHNDVFQFVLIGQSIDRKLYDNLNSYTDENGSDGVVRVASGNLNATYVKLVQEFDGDRKRSLDWRRTRFRVAAVAHAPPTAFAVLPGLSHSGKKMGIMRTDEEHRAAVTLDNILACLQVRNAAGYQKVIENFTSLTKETQKQEHTEEVSRVFLGDRKFHHPLTTQMIVRLTDDNGWALQDFDFLLTAWDPNARLVARREPNPNLLPEGFFIDRQLNQRQRNTLTYYLNHEAIHKAPALGIRIIPRPEPPLRPKVSEDYFVHYLRADYGADAETLLQFLKPNETLLVDVVLKRIVREGVFRLTTRPQPEDFTNDPPGKPIDAP